MKSPARKTRETSRKMFGEHPMVTFRMETELAAPISDTWSRTWIGTATCAFYVRRKGLKKVRLR